jgi:hypothetical protein
MVASLAKPSDHTRKKVRNRQYVLHTIADKLAYPHCEMPSGNGHVSAIHKMPRQAAKKLHAVLVSR